MIRYYSNLLIKIKQKQKKLPNFFTRKKLRVCQSIGCFEIRASPPHLNLFFILSGTRWKLMKFGEQWTHITVSENFFEIYAKKKDKSFTKEAGGKILMTVKVK